MCGCACMCGPKNWGADACAAHFQNVCDVRAGADENPRTLKVCQSDSTPWTLTLSKVHPQNDNQESNGVHVQMVIPNSFKSLHQKY